MVSPALTYWPPQKSAPLGVWHCVLQPPSRSTVHFSCQSMFACTVHEAPHEAWQEASQSGGSTEQATSQRLVQSASQSFWQSELVHELWQLDLHVVVQLPEQSMLPAVQLAEHEASHVPVQLTSGSAVHSPSQAATSLSGLQSVSQPPETSRSQLPSAMS